MMTNINKEELAKISNAMIEWRVKHTNKLVNQVLYTITRETKEGAVQFLTYFSEHGKEFKGFGRSYEIQTSEIVDNDEYKVYKGYLVDDVLINGEATSYGLDTVALKYKAYSEAVGKVEFNGKSYFSVLEGIAESTKEYYDDLVNGTIPEVHIIGESTEDATDTLYEKDIKSHGDILSEYHSVVAEISEASRQINQNTRLEDLRDLSESFLATREKLKELSGAGASKVQAVGQGIFDKFKGIPLIGRAISQTKELKAKTDNVQDNIDALFILINKQYNRLVEVGEGLQSAKKKQEAQCTRLEKLIIASDSFIGTYKNQADIPVRELSANNQIKTSYEKLRKRILKTEAAIMGTQASIISLGKDLPCSKSEMTEELALSGLLNSVTDYQTMYSDITTLLNEVVEVTSEKTYKVVENLMDLQINDTHTLAYLSKDNQRAKEFATMLTDKSQKLADKVKSDANMIKEIASGTSILEAREKVKSLGYN